MFRVVRLAGPLALLALVVLSSNLSLAQGSAADQAATLIDQGIDLRVAQRDEKALELFEKANALSPSPRATAQIGLAEQALGRWVAAEEHLVAALAASSDPWILKNQAVLHDSVRQVRTHLGSIQIESNVPGAEVWVNGVLVGNTPMSKPARVAAASAVISVRAPGYSATEVRRDVAADALVRESVRLVPIRTDDAPSSAAQGKPLTTAALTPSTPAGEVAGNGSSQRTWGYVAGGAGILGLAATGVLAGLALDKTRGLPAACKNDPSHGCTPQQGDSINSARSLAGIANFTFGAGLLGVGVGALMLLFSPSSSSSKAASVDMSPAVGPGFGGVRIGGAF